VVDPKEPWGKVKSAVEAAEPLLSVAYFSDAGLMLKPGGKIALSSSMCSPQA